MTRTESPEFSALQAAVGGRYVLDRELGRGGMGIVFLAREVALDRLVAIKLLPPTLASQPELVVRFLQEARTAARLAHPHIVPIHAVEQHDDLVFFVMGYISGTTLAERVRAEGPLEPAAVSRVVQEVAWALAHAHQQGVVHRDVKPENILLERGTGRALVTDFGIAQLREATPVTGPQRLMGTARFVSPEQAAGEPLDGRSDLYSLGVTAFFALTGRFPFDAADPRALLSQHLTLPAPPVASVRRGIPPLLAATIDRCLAKSRDDRFPSAGALADAAAGTREGAETGGILSRIAREVSAFGVDLTGYGTLAFVAIVTQLLRGTGMLGLSGDFLGIGYVYTLAIALVLLSLTALRGISVWRLIRDAVAEGWDERDLARAIERDARRTEARARAPALGRPASLGVFLVGLIAVVAFWLGPKEAGESAMEGVLVWVIELVSFIAPIALGRWLGARLEQPLEGRPGLFSRLVLRFKASFLFRVARIGHKRATPPTATADQPTEVLLADAARDVLRALPDPDRHRFGADVEQLLSRLERDAAAQRKRLVDLDGVAAQLGTAAGARRDDLARDLDAARRETAERLETTARAMESLRLDLLRHVAGLASTDGLTDDLETLKDIAARVDAAAELDRPTPT